MADPIIELREATVFLGDACILDRLSLTLRRGEHAAILGPNGAGKSTLMKLLALQLYPVARDDGAPAVRIFGRDRWDVFELRSRLGMVSADLHDAFTHGNSNGSIAAREAVVSGFFATQGLFRHHRVTGDMRRRAAGALEAMGVAHLADTPLGAMSTGEARRVLIARALVHDPALLVLDEPTRGLDLASRFHFMEQVRRVALGGTTLLLVTHHIDEIVPEIERVILLQRGTVAYDGAKSEALTVERLTPVFGASLVVDASGGYYHVRVTADRSSRAASTARSEQSV